MNNKSLLLDLQEERGFSAFIPISFLTQYSLLSCSEGGPKPSAFHLLELAGLHLHRLSGVLWSLRGAHPHGALLPDSSPQPLARGFSPCWLGPCQICGGCWRPLCSYVQVSVRVSPRQLSDAHAPQPVGLRDKRERHLAPCRLGSACPGLPCFSTSSHVSPLSLPASWVTCSPCLG